MKTWTEKTLDRITSHNITEAELRHMRLRIRRALNGHYTRRDYAISEHDAYRIIDAVETVRPVVEYSQAVKGAQHLHALAFRKDGTPRQTEAAGELRQEDMRVIRELQDVPAFRLVGFEMPERGRYVQACLPIYRAIGQTQWFDYVAPSWQSGFKFAVINRGDN